MERLQRVLADGGIASRRHAEELILAGRVTVDGLVVRELGTRVDPSRQVIRVDGQVVRWEPRRYIMLNKPDGYITTASDERGRRTVLDLVQVPERVVPVGRLDRHTSGLLLLTNDGELLYRVTHPRFELPKEYEALLDGHPPPDVLRRLRDGIVVDGVRVVPEQVRPVRNEESGTVIRIVIHEGRNRIVRRMLERVGYPVLKLHRTRIGPLSVRGLKVGEWRDLTSGELEQLAEALKVDERGTRAPQRVDDDRGPRDRGVARGGPPPVPRRPSGPSPAGRSATPLGRRPEPRTAEEADRSRRADRSAGPPARTGGPRPPRESSPPTGRRYERPEEPGRDAVVERDGGRHDEVGPQTPRGRRPAERRPGPQGPPRSGVPRGGKPGAPRPRRDERGPKPAGGRPQPSDGGTRGSGPGRGPGRPSRPVGDGERGPRRPGGGVPPASGGGRQQGTERGRDRQGPTGGASGNRHRRPGGGRQEHRGQRGRPQD